MGDEEALEDAQEIWKLHSLPDVPLLNPETRKEGGGSGFGVDEDDEDEDWEFRILQQSKPSRRPAILS